MTTVNDIKKNHVFSQFNMAWLVNTALKQCDANDPTYLLHEGCFRNFSTMTHNTEDWNWILISKPLAKILAILGKPVIDGYGFYFVGVAPNRNIDAILQEAIDFLNQF